MKKTLIIIMFLGVFIGVNAQKREVKITSEKIAENIFMLKGQGGNIVILTTPKEVLMIDAQFAPLTDKILSEIKRISDKPVNYLINTHWHGDHTGGNENMGKTGAVIVSHENVRKRMNTDQTVWGKTKPAAPKEALPVITFSDNLHFYKGKEEVFVTHVHNAHTDGDALVYFMTSNVLHTGDTYFQGKFPYIDLGSGGSINGYIKGVEKILMLIDDDTKIVPGHGVVSSKKELKTYLIMLKDLKFIISEEISKGKTLQEIKDNKELLKKYKSYNGWITEEKIKEAIYKSLTNK